MKAILTILCLSIFVCTASGGILSLVADTTTPESNDEITVWVHATDPLFFLDMRAYVVGDATILSAMSETDCDEYGWDISFNPTPMIDPEGWVHIGGICWAADADGVVGYFTFRYNSGQVAVFIDQENTTAFHWNGGLAISETTLWFGDPILPEPQEPNEPERIFLECPPIAGGLPRNLGGESFGSGRDRKISEVTRNGLYSQLTLIEVDSDITTNQIWTPDNVYYITEQTVNVQALLVIEPGTLIIFGQDCAMFINNDGTLISRGSPDNLITYTCDYLYFYYPEEIGTYWYDLYYTGEPYYYSPIYIEETASPSTTITYSFIEGAVAGVVTENIRLDHPIENNYLFANIYGIYESGPELTDIKNNLLFHSDVSAIEIYLADGNGAADSNTFIAIENNTCDFFQYCGISIHGVADENDAGTVVLANNIVSGAYWYGLNLVDGHMLAIVANTGYYDNGINKNWAFDEYDPVQATQDPYTSGTLLHESHFLDQASPFIDAGAVYIDQTRLIGMTTDVNSQPDSGLVDIGFHYPNWGFSNAGIGLTETDFNKDGITGYEDLFVLTSQWLESVAPGSEGDLNNDGIIDFEDFAVFTESWRKIQGSPNIVASVSGNPNSGWVNIGVSDVGPNTQQVSVFVNGRYIGKIFGFRNGNILGVDISEFGNREQSIKLISVNGSGHITCSEVANVVFENPLSYCILPQSYEPNEPLYFSGYNNGTGDASVKVYANGGDLVWAQTYSGNTVMGFIPALITNQHEIDYVNFESSNGPIVSKVTDPSEPDFLPADPNVKALVVLPNLLIRLYDYRTISQVQRAFKDRGIKYKRLAGRSANYSNLAKYAKTGNVKYLYVIAHGSYIEADEYTGVLRTGVGLWDEWVVSAKASDFYLGQAPSWCEPLPGNLEDTTRSFAAMGFSSLELAYSDSCYSGHLKINAYGFLVMGQSGQIGLFDGPHSDMSIALGLGDSSKSRVYQGWYGEATSRLWPLQTSYQRFSRHQWESLGNGNNLAQAITSAISQQTDFGPDAPVNNYRIKGQGYITEIRLRSN